MKCDIVVIGAGALGLSTALHCALLGRSVVVIERREAGSQASGRAAGLFKSVQADELRTILARHSMSRAIDFADWAGAPLEVSPSGSFLIARTGAHQEYLRAEARQSASWGVEVTEADAGAVAERMPGYRGYGTELALWCPEDVYIEEPMSLIRALTAACRRHGVELAEAEQVTGVTLAGGRVRGAVTSSRSITAPVVVDAAGAWTRQVARLAGGTIAVTPVRHQLLITEPDPQVDPAQPILRVVDAAVYLRPARGGLMFGGFEPDPLPVDPQVRAPSFDTGDLPLDLGVLLKMAGQVVADVPLLAEVLAAEVLAGELPGAGRPVAEHRGGMLTMSPDGRFVAGPVPDAAGLWVASGCNGSGFSSSLAIGEALAGWICEIPKRLDISALSPERFGPLTESELISAGVWQYAHYYDPAGRPSGPGEPGGVVSPEGVASPVAEPGPSGRPA